MKKVLSLITIKLTKNKAVKSFTNFAFLLLSLCHPQNFPFLPPLIVNVGEIKEKKRKEKKNKQTGIISSQNCETYSRNFQVEYEVKML